jgi:hypothetical protein
MSSSPTTPVLARGTLGDPTDERCVEPDTVPILRD